MSELILLFLPLSLLPPAIDDLLDYYVDDVTWVPSIPFIVYALLVGLDKLVGPLFIFLTLVVPLYLISRREGEMFGEGDLILYFIYVFYSVLMGGVLHYIFLILFTNIYGFIFYVIRMFWGIKENVIPLIFLSPFSVFTTMFILVS